MERIISTIIVIASFILGICGHHELTEIVKTEKGFVRGVKLKTVENSVEYSAFKGIPYGKPPIGYLRFKPPIETDNWDNTLDAISEANRCPQFYPGPAGFIGNEDCLYLNVYTPRRKFNSTDEQLLAVMVWIYGGGFYEGTISSSVFGPDFLIENNVVVVAMNYRLGALGFLSLNHPNATGNAGLKDQVLALKWVQRNIKNFGGDPTKVTIFGQSAGGDSVELHKVSDKSRGLFSRSIAMSGSPLNPWGFASINSALSKASAFGRNLNLTTTDVQVFLQNLYETSVKDIVTAALDMITPTDMGFIPVLEDRNINTKDAFITDCAIHRYKWGNYQDLPHMLGFVSSETIFLAHSILYDIMGRQSLPAVEKPILNLIRPDIMQQSIAISTDLWFVAGIDRTQQYLSRGNAPVYYYRNSFDYDAALHKMEGSPGGSINGTGHSDDLAHLFWKPNKNQSLDPTSDIAIQRKIMVRLWTNFAKFGDPTPNGTDDPIIKTRWTASGADGFHLDISNDGLKMGPRPTDIFVKFLGKFLEPVEEILNGCSSK